MSRLLDFYLATATQVFIFEYPGDTRSSHLECVQQPGLHFPNRNTALEWLFAEARCLLACARQSADATTLRRASDLMLVTEILLESGANAHQYKQVTAELLAAAQKVGDAHAEGRLRRVAALARIMEGQSDKRDQEARCTVALYARSHDPVALAGGLNHGAILATACGRYDDAEAYLTQALDEFRSYANPSGEAAVLSNLARIYLETRRLAAAMEFAERSLTLYRDIGATFRLANAL